MRKENGFSAIEALVIILILVAVGAAAFFVYKNVNDNDDKKNSTSSKTSTSQITKNTNNASGANNTTYNEAYAGWKTYTSKVEGFSFRYPADWQLSNTLDPKDTVTKESVGLKTSNYFTLGFDVYKPDSVGREYKCVNCVFNGVKPLEGSNYGKPLYLVVDSNKVNGDNPFQTLSVSGYSDRNEQNLKGWPYYNSKTHPGYVVRWRGECVKPEAGGELFYSTYDEFINKPEVITAKKILESISY